MAEKFCRNFGSGPHQLKIGKSFDRKDKSVFHSIRYDFTPLSVDENKMGRLEVEERSGVSVTLPHTNGVDSTKYTGPAKEANPRECILIIDHETGELTLERLSNQIILKKTRAERNPSSSTSSAPPEGSLPAGKPGNPYEVKREPDKPKMGSSGRPITPSSTKQKRTANTPTEDQASCGSPAPSPARQHHTAPPPPVRGRGLSESSDSSSSGSDSDSDSNGEDSSCPLNAAMEASSTPETFSMPGDVSDLLLPGSGGLGQGHLPTPRPQKMHKSKEKTKQSTKPEKPTPAPAPIVAGSMPNFDDFLGDDLQLTDESDDN